MWCNSLPDWCDGDFKFTCVDVNKLLAAVTDESACANVFRGGTAEDVPRDLDAVKASPEDLAETKIEEDEADLSCAICNKRMKDKSRYRVHVKAHKGSYPTDNFTRGETAECKFDAVGAPPPDLGNTKVEEDETDLLCVICNKTIKDKKRYLMHVKAHEGSYAFKCTQCDKRYMDKAGLKYHKEKVHLNKSYKCTVCEKIYRDISYYRSHLKTHDPGYKAVTFKCDVCSMELKTRSSYRLHKRKHDGLKFMCYVCGKELSSNASLNDHLKLHSGEKPFVCETCGKAFAKKTVLEMHIRVHTKEKPFPCAICGRKFSQMTSVRVHVKSVHTGEKSHACGICGKMFATKTMMKLHGRIHGVPIGQAGNVD